MKAKYRVQSFVMAMVLSLCLVSRAAGAEETKEDAAPGSEGGAGYEVNLASASGHAIRGALAIGLPAAADGREDGTITTKLDIPENFCLRLVPVDTGNSQVFLADSDVIPEGLRHLAHAVDIAEIFNITKSAEDYNDDPLTNVGEENKRSLRLTIDKYCPPRFRAFLEESSSIAKGCRFVVVVNKSVEFANVNRLANLVVTQLSEHISLRDSNKNTEKTWQENPTIDLCTQANWIMQSALGTAGTGLGYLLGFSMGMPLAGAALATGLWYLGDKLGSGFVSPDDHAKLLRLMIASEYRQLILEQHLETGHACLYWCAVLNSIDHTPYQGKLPGKTKEDILKLLKISPKSHLHMPVFDGKPRDPLVVEIERRFASNNITEEDYHNGVSLPTTRVKYDELLNEYQLDPRIRKWPGECLSLDELLLGKISDAAEYGRSKANPRLIAFSENYWTFGIKKRSMERSRYAANQANPHFAAGHAAMNPEDWIKDYDKGPENGEDAADNTLGYMAVTKAMWQRYPGTVRPEAVKFEKPFHLPPPVRGCTIS